MTILLVMTLWIELWFRELCHLVILNMAISVDSTLVIFAWASLLLFAVTPTSIAVGATVFVYQRMTVQDTTLVMLLVRRCVILDGLIPFTAVPPVSSHCYVQTSILWSVPLCKCYRIYSFLVCVQLFVIPPVFKGPVLALMFVGTFCVIHFPWKHLVKLFGPFGLLWLQVLANLVAVFLCMELILYLPPSLQLQYWLCRIPLQSRWWL